MRRLPSLALLLLLAAACSDTTIGDVCAPGAQRCNSNAYETCTGDGLRWVVAEDCAAAGNICVLNLGCRTCVPNNLSCAPDGFDIVRCNGEGTASETIGRCDPESGDQCVGGECQNACAHAAETRSYEGCEYWATDLDNAVVSNLGPATAQQYAIVVSNPLELPATITVSVNDAPPGMPVQERIVDTYYLSRIEGGGDLEVIELDPRELDCASDPRLNDGSHSCLSSNAYHLTSTAPIVAYQFNPLENQPNVFSNDASLLLPQSALGTQYLVMGWPQTLATTEDAATNGGIDLRSFLTIVATQPATHVQVKLTALTLGAQGIPPGLPGEVLELDLGPYDVVNLETDDFNADFTGTSITSNEPIAVFSGSEAADVPFFTTWADRDCCADHLEEQLFPETAFGTQFVAVKSPLRTTYVDAAGWDVALVPDEPEYWRILGSAEDTTVTTDLPPPYDSFLLTRGQVVTFDSERDFLVQASKPISFAQFPASQQTTGIPSIVMGTRAPGGDPSMIMVPPLQQWKDKYVFLVPSKYVFDFLLLAIPAEARLRFDGEDLEAALPRCVYEPIGTLPDPGGVDREYVAVRCPLSDPIWDDPLNQVWQNDGRHVLESEGGEPFGLVVYGWDSFVSYGYPGGMNLETINPQ